MLKSDPATLGLSQLKVNTSAQLLAKTPMGKCRTTGVGVFCAVEI